MSIDLTSARWAALALAALCIGGCDLSEDEAGADAGMSADPGSPLRKLGSDHVGMR